MFFGETAFVFSPTTPYFHGTIYQLEEEDTSCFYVCCLNFIIVGLSCTMMHLLSKGDKVLGSLGAVRWSGVRSCEGIRHKKYEYVADGNVGTCEGMNEKAQ
jgi:hypothetical protein